MAKLGKPIIDPIMGTPGLRVITIENVRSAHTVIPGGVQSHIHGNAGEGENRKVKILYRNMYLWVPWSKVRPVEPPPVAAEEPAAGTDGENKSEESAAGTGEAEEKGTSSKPNKNKPKDKNKFTKG